MELALQPSTNQQLSNSLMGLEAQLEAAVLRDLEVQGITDLTEIERHALVEVEKLRKTNSIDLATVMMRGALIRRIEEEGLWNYHPGGQYTNMTEMATAQGISVSEFSDIRRLCDVVFPYMINTLGVHPAERWEEIGKSKFRELSSVLSIIIEHRENDSDKSANRSAIHFLNIEAAAAQTVGEEIDDNTLRARTVETILQLGELPANEVRTHLRPDRTPSIAANFIRTGDHRYFIAELSDDQFDMIRRRLSGHMDPVEVTLPDNPTARANEAARVRMIREIANLVVL
ncbi:MAG: hypothetical protein KQI81_09060 [Deltaproteobacteria bacterium]|nr:hypothetical protein [Deltaproteobacteria bacterium]